MNRVFLAALLGCTCAWLTPASAQRGPAEPGTAPQNPPLETELPGSPDEAPLKKPTWGEEPQPAQPAQPEAPPPAPEAPPPPPPVVPPPPPAVAPPVSPAEPVILDDFKVRPTDMQTMVVGSPEVAPVRQGRARLVFNLFGDNSFIVQESTGPHAPPAFVTGALDLLATGYLGNGVSATAELLFTTDSTGGVEADLERFHLRWQNDTFLVVAGRFHSELGFWNNAYHHGKWLQLPIDRPRVVRFDNHQELIPAHIVGLQLGANIPLRRDAFFNIRAEVGNGRGSVASVIQQKSDDNDAKAFVLKLELQGIGAPALRIGLAGAYDRIPPQNAMVRPALPNTEIHEAIGAAYFAHPGNHLTFIAEAYLFQHFAGERDWTTLASFLVAGYRFGTLTPYVVLDHQHMRGGGPDPYFVPNPAMARLGDSFEGIAGLRWDLAPWSALKVEYGQTHPVYAAGDVAFRGAVNWSFGI